MVSQLITALLAPLLLLASMAAYAAPSLAWGDKPKYPAGFRHFDYVNPSAPRQGSINLDGFGSFDSLNPLTLKGIAPGWISLLMFETLAEPSDDEPFSMYGLLAQDMEFASDGLSVTFRLNTRARFSNGDPVLAQDVKYSFDTLMSKAAHPRFRQYFGDVARAVVIDPETVRFEFRRRNHELHMIIGSQMPVFSPKWAAARPFDSVMQDPPLTSGPYLVKRVDWGKTITFQRNPQYWGADLPVRRGQFNFQRITFKYFKDDTARLEGFKAGEFDWIAEYSAKNWARGHVGRHYRSGEIVKRQFKHSNAAGMQGFVLNTRRAQFADARVRKALALAFDFEWMNRQIFYGQYLRSPSYFTNSEMQAQGRPSDAELSLIRSLKERVQPKILSDEAPVPATTKAPESLRGNLRQAMALLSAAGWVVADDGRLRNAAGEAFEFEVLSGSKGSERIAVPWARNMEKLGITVRLRVSDPALYRKRLDDFDFDVAVQVLSSSQTPGNELIERFSSEAATVKGSDNLAGVRDPAIDEIIRRLLLSSTRAELVAWAQVLDRFLRHGWYMVPHFHAPAHRVAYRKRLSHPQTLPLYYSATSWMLRTWWAEP